MDGESTPKKTQPVNRLEVLLAQAVADAGRRPEFLYAFLESDLFIIGVGGSEPTQEASQDGRLELRYWLLDDQPILPVFSSLDRLRAFIDREEAYIRIGCRSLLRLLDGEMIVVLNPGSPPSETFTQAELAKLLDGSAFSLQPGETLEAEQQLLLSQPADYPQELVDALTTLFRHRPYVEAAYLAQAALSASEAALLIVGVLGRGHLRNVLGEAAMVANEVLGEDGPEVRFVALDHESGISTYMRQSLPFYAEAASER
jgi:hypothetical protein